MNFNPFKNKLDIKNVGIKKSELDVSRRNFLFKAAGVVTAIGYGKLSLDFLNDPAQKEKVFTEISLFFNERAMEVKLEQERKDFYDKYGIQLDLKSLGETNQISLDKNEIEVQRLELVKRISSEVYGREVSKKLKSPTDSDMQTVNLEYEKMIQQITDKYTKENPSFFVNSIYSSTLSNFEKLQLVDQLKEVFSLYPVNFIKRLKIKTINAGRDPSAWNTEKNTSIPLSDGGYALKHLGKSSDIDKNRIIYLDFSPNDYVSYMQKRQQVFSVTSHELSHMKDNENTNDNQSEMLEEWKNFNLGLGGLDYIGSYYSQLNGAPTGFYNSYGTSQPAEDRATIVEALWSDALKLEELCSIDKILTAKVTAIKKEYFKMDSRFNEEYWTLLREGKMDAVKNHVKYNIKK